MTIPAPGAGLRRRGEEMPIVRSGVAAEVPFCGHCGARLASSRSSHACTRCGRANEQGFKFCPACGASYGGTGPQAAVVPAGDAIPAGVSAPRLALMDRSGEIAQRFELVNAVTTVGRQGADINFADDD